ncbi:MAG: hypothetical protein ACUVT7_02175 [Thermoplasmata archaeon]
MVRHKGFAEKDSHDDGNSSRPLAIGGISCELGFLFRKIVNRLAG